MMKKILASILALALFVAPVAAQQTPQGAAGTILGNDTAATRNMRPASVSAILDRALSSTRGSIIARTATGWASVGPGTTGLPWVSAGAGADPLYQILGIVGGGTGINVYAIGDIICATGTTTLSKISDIATGNALISGGVGACPTYGKITSAHITGQALTKTDDTNVTLTLGGTPASALVNASSLTLGWTGTLAVARGGTGGGSASGTLLDNISGFSGTGYIRRTGAGTYAFSAAATAAQYFAGTATNAPIEPSIIYQSPTTTTFGATTTFDFATFNDSTVIMTGNITTMNVVNGIAGKKGNIMFQQDATGGRTTVWNSIFKFPGGVTPTLSTAANATDVLMYDCRVSTFCIASLMKDVK